MKRDCLALTRMEREIWMDECTNLDKIRSLR